eukprot:1039670-Alexandrium_andersonii.AAC.1
MCIRDRRSAEAPRRASTHHCVPIAPAQLWHSTAHAQGAIASRMPFFRKNLQTLAGSERAGLERSPLPPNAGVPLE